MRESPLTQLLLPRELQLHPPEFAEVHVKVKINIQEV